MLRYLIEYDSLSLRKGAEVVISDLCNKGVVILLMLIARHKFAGASR